MNKLLALVPLALFLGDSAAAADVPWLAETQQHDNVPLPATPLVELVSSKDSAESRRTSWNSKRNEVRAAWLSYLNPWQKKRGPAPKYTVLESETVGGVLRQRIAYQAEPGEMTEAYLLRPKQVSAKSPAVLVFHSTVNHSIRQPAGVQGKPEKAFGLKLAEMGMICLCPRNFLWPDNHKIDATPQTEKFHERHPNSKGMAKMLWDAQVALDLLLSVEGVDAERIGAVGHSLGAKEVLYLAAFDERVKVTVSSEGGIGTTFSNWDAPWYLGKPIKMFGREHHELLGLVAPRAFLLIGGDSADGKRSWPFVEKALPVYRLYGDSARVGLYNHGQGHAVPPEAEKRIYEWLTTYLADEK